MSDSVTIHVGTTPDQYMVHSARLRKSSKFFEKALEKVSCQSFRSRRVIDLADENSACFKVYLHWLYDKTLPTMISQDLESDSNMEGSVDTEYHLLSNCYAMGERLMDNGFKNAVVDALVEARLISHTGNCWEPCVGTVTIIYTGTPEHSQARRLMINMWRKHADKSWITVLPQMPFAFVNDLVEAFIENKRSSHMHSVRLDPKLFHEA